METFTTNIDASDQAIIGFKYRINRNEKTKTSYPIKTTLDYEGWIRDLNFSLESVENTNFNKTLNTVIYENLKCLKFEKTEQQDLSSLNI